MFKLLSKEKPLGRWRPPTMMILATLVLVAAPGWSQTAPQTADDRTSEVQENSDEGAGASEEPDEAAATEQAKGQAVFIEEVVVTAQKRAQTLSDVGISVTAFNNEQMRVLGIDTSADVALYTPGFTITDASAQEIPVYTIRGVGFDDTQPNSSSTVGVYNDEVNLPYPVMTSFQQFDLERIEVLKGPQGDLYGRNTTAGALNYIANRPTNEFEAGIVNTGFASYQTARLEAYVNGPLGDRVNGRIAIVGNRRGDGWQENELDDRVNGEHERYGVRGLLDWIVSDKVDILFNFHYGNNQGEPQVPQATAVLPSSNDAAAMLYALGYYPIPSLDPLLVENQDDPRAARWDLDSSNDATMTGGSLTLNWDLGGPTLTSISAYDAFERQMSLDWDGLAIKSLETTSDKTSIDAASQELRVTSGSGGDLTWIGGLYFSWDKLDTRGIFDATESPTIGFTAGQIAKQTTRTGAAYGHLEWQFSDKWRLNAGARYTDEKREIENCSIDTGDGTLVATWYLFEALGYFVMTNPEDLVPGGCVHLESAGEGSPPPVRIAGLHKDSITTSKATGKIGIDFLPSDNWLIYGSVGTGFKSGGYNIFVGLTVEQFQPYTEEELTSVEIGFKGSTANRSLIFNGAAFHYDYRDKQVSTFIPDSLGIFPGLAAIQNVPESVVQGAELELRWMAADRLMLMANTTFLDTEIKEYETCYDAFFNVPCEAVGLSLPNAPEVSFTAGARYDANISSNLLLRPALIYTYQSDSRSQIPENSVWDVPSYGLLDARLELGSQDGTWIVSLWGKNLTDEKYWFSNSLSQDTAVRYTGLPRTFGLGLTYNW